LEAITERPMTPPDYQPKEKNCLKCAHHTTCVIYRYAVRFVQTEFPDNGKPFKPEETAKICKFYNPLQRIETITD
jgi:hypothetical protein